MATGCHGECLNPKPSTLNPKPSTLNPQPSTLNPKRYSKTLNSFP
jgi:phosphopantothenoylcysteine decarboxylase/phosphopantothenate--cysteine ligase